MTKAEWLEADSVALVGAQRSASDRKLRLVACALGRSIWPRLTPLGRRAVEVAEDFADGCEPARTLLTYRARVEAAGDYREPGSSLWVPVCAVMECGWYAAELSVGCALDPREEAPIVRDIFGSPFRPTTIDSAWLAWDGGTIPGIAQGIYEEAAYNRLPILADALEDAGCADADILDHCRGGGPHVRGCWVVDLLLGKT
jgi:hypothetical protein